MKYKKKLFLFLRVFVTCSLLFLIYRQIDINVVKDVLATSNYFFILLALLIFIISNITGAVQWYCLLRSQSVHSLSFFYVIRLYLASAFFNNFLPTNVGGDVVKIYKLIKSDLKKDVIFSSIIWDRFVSLLILLFFSFIAGYMLLKSNRVLYGLCIFLFLICLAVLLIRKYKIGNFILKITRKVKSKKIKNFLDDFLISFKIYLQRSGYIFSFYLLSFITQFLKIYFAVYIAKAMNIPLNMLEIFVVIPVIGIISALPISINGLGLREIIGSYLFVFLNKEKALISIFITIGNIVIILGNLVGIFFIFDKNKKYDMEH